MGREAKEAKAGRRDGKEQDRGSSEAFFKALEKLPYLGPWLVFIIKRWGWGGLALFFAGALIALGLVKLNALPVWILPSAQVQGAAKSTLDAERVKPTDASVEPAPADPWLDEMTQIYHQRGAAEQVDSGDPNFVFSAKAVQHTFDRSTKEVTWALTTEQSHEIQATAFRVDARGFFQPLKASAAARAVEFKVPECEKGDRLVAVVLTTWRDGRVVEDIRSTFRPTFK